MEKSALRAVADSVGVRDGTEAVAWSRVEEKDADVREVELGGVCCEELIVEEYDAGVVG
jgi:hypothetical protein